jgi:hypothetical protein
MANIKLSDGAKSANINTFRDMRLSKIKITSGGSATYNNQSLHLFNKNNDFHHKKIKYGATYTNDLMTIKDVGSVPYYNNDEIRELNNISKLHPDQKKFFISAFVDYPYIYMDFFEENLYDFLETHDLSIKERERIFSFVFEGVNIIKLQGKCFTDIKPEQILIRSNSEQTGKYHTFVASGRVYEICMADLDYKLCVHNSQYMSTYKLPSWLMSDVRKRNSGNEANVQTAFALGSTGLRIFGLNEDKYLTSNNNKDNISKDLSEIKHLGVSDYIYNTIKNCIYDTSALLSWLNVVRTYSTD